MKRVTLAGLLVVLSGCGDSAALGGSTYCEKLRFAPCDPGLGGSGGEERSPGFGGDSGVGGNDGFGGAGGAPDPGCWANVDCAEGEWCIIQDEDGLPIQPWGSPTPGECRDVDENTYVFSFSIDLVDGDGVSLPGTYDVDLSQNYWGDRPLPAPGTAPDFALPGLIVGTPFFFGLRYYAAPRYEGFVITCDIHVNQNGLISGGEIIEGDAIGGTLVCDSTPLTDVRAIAQFSVTKR